MKTMKQNLIEDLVFFRELSSGLQWNQATKELLSNLETSARNLLLEHMKLETGELPVHVVIAGNFNAGKSSFLNSLFQKSICPIAHHATTAHATSFRYGERKRILDPEKQEIADTKYPDAICERAQKTNSGIFEYYLPMDLLRSLTLTDTPGFSAALDRNGESKITSDLCQKADIIFLVVNINDGAIGSELAESIEEIRAENPDAQWFLILNWADTKPARSARKILKSIQEDHPGLFDGYFLYSAKLVMQDSQLPWDEFFQALKSSIISNIDKEGTYSPTEMITEKSGRFSSKFSLNVGGEQFDFHHSNDFFSAQKDTLLHLLKTIAREKLNYHNRRLNSFEKRHLQRCLHLIPQVLKSIECDVEPKSTAAERELYLRALKQKISWLCKKHWESGESEYTPLMAKLEDSFLQTASKHPTQEDFARYLKSRWNHQLRNAPFFRILSAEGFGEKEQLILTRVQKLIPVLETELPGFPSPSSQDLGNADMRQLHSWMQRVFKGRCFKILDRCEGWWEKHQSLRNIMIQKITDFLQRKQKERG